MNMVSHMDFKSRLLVVDDDRGIRELVASFLADHGFGVETAADGAAMRTALAGGGFDLVILDVMMPGEDGLSILRSLPPGARPPVIMMSVMGSDVDRIVGLELGADDYLAKPFNPRELLARVRAVLRRGEQAGAPPPSSGRFLFAGCALDPVSRELYGEDGAAVALTDGEFRLLLAFVERPRRVLTRDQLLDLSRGSMTDNYDRAIDVQLSRLRRKLPGGEGGGLIRTIRNEGYLFTADVIRG